MMFAALYLPPLPGRAADARVQLMAVAREFSPRVERLRDDLLLLDVSGLARWFENSRALGEALRRTAADRGLAAHIAVAATRTAALLCARGRAGLTVALPGDEAARLGALPLDVLVAWTAPDAGRSRPRTPLDSDRVFPIATLKRWGLKTLGDLANLPSVELSERLGQAGIIWQRLARGEDLRPLVPTLPDEHYEESLELEWPIEQLEPLSFVLGRLLETLCVRLEQADRGVAVLHVRLDLAGVAGRERQRFARALQLPAPMRDARTLRTLALLDLESNPPPAAVDRVTVAAEVVEGRVLQFSLLARALSAECVSTLLARLSALMGSDRVGALALVDSYRPGAFAMKPFNAEIAKAAAVAESSNLSNFARFASFFSGRGAPLPLAAASRTSRSAAAAGAASSALKELPDVSRQLPAVIRRFRQPIPAHVDVQQGRPVRVTSGRRHLRGGCVEVCAGPWRTSGEWWKAPAAAATSESASRGAASAWGWGPTRLKESRYHSSAWDRDEWEVRLRDGATYLIFQNRARGSWFIDGIFD